jgi:four helix bundle protein
MKPELQNRLVKFSGMVIWLASDLKECYAGKHLYSQIVRSATSAALNYGEAQAAETRKDFNHKLGIVFKELKETEVNLEIILESMVFKQDLPFVNALKETRELVAIFSATLKTVRKKEG